MEAQLVACDVKKQSKKAGGIHCRPSLMLARERENFLGWTSRSASIGPCSKARLRLFYLSSLPRLHVVALPAAADQFAVSQLPV